MVAFAVGSTAVLAAAAWTWGDASNTETSNPVAEPAVQAIRAQLRDVLPQNGEIRVEYRGDPYNLNGPGVIYWLIRDGFDITTQDGDHGLKWGHEHRWNEGERYDRRLTVAVQYPGGRYDPLAKCMEDSSAELIASYDSLSAEERAWVRDVTFERMADKSSVSDEDLTKARALNEEALRIGVFDDTGNCAGNSPSDPDRFADRGAAPPLPAVLAAVAAAAVLVRIVRKRVARSRP